MREIKISKHKGNTHYTAHVVDSFGTEHHIGYYNNLRDNTLEHIEHDAEYIWANEVEPKEDLLDKAIANCIELDKKLEERKIIVNNLLTTYKNKT